MTYYGRWTYKFEEAARRGAIAALIVHDAEGVGYGWNVVKSAGGENYGLVVPPEKVTSLALQGWISGETATKLFADARSEEHTSELQSLMRISYAVFCLKKKK